MFKKVMVSLDGSKYSEQIMPFATDIATKYGAELVLFHAVHEPVTFVPPMMPGLSSVPVETQKMINDMNKQEKDAEIYLEQWANTLMETGLNVECVTIIGDASQSIIDYATENDVDLIAITTHGRGGLNRAVFGSVADYVIKESHIPTLVIHPKDTK
jgi:nucleotide-binding universal stress UspA family protein